MAAPSFLAPLARHPRGSYRLVNARTGVVVAHTLLAAFDSASRKKGLLGCDGLPEGTAMIIAPSNAVHTFFMRFSIDLVFVAKDGRVLKVRHAVPARRVAAALRSHAVIELPAGTLKRCNTIEGDTLTLDQA